MKKPGSASNSLWFKDAILYELHVRSFADSNADGIGDFIGLLGKLDYLQELGVTCLWLLPFFPSPLRDDGYDIADYKNVHPSYGTLEDFQRFLDAAHARGMQVVIELVMNHSSDQHPWFQRARNAPAGSAERNFYVWSDSDQRFAGVPIIFNDTETSNWTWDAVAGAYYWHRFFSHQPDLNYDNPAVLDEMLDAMRFWLDRGVDGLRLDAIPYLVERDGTRCENLPETHAIIRTVRAVIDAEYSNRFLLAEANQWPSDVRPYFGENDECNMAFHFPLMPRIYVAVRQEDRLPIVDIMEQTPAIPDTCQWGLFLRNHDELTLEMVTRDERDYMYLAYSSDPRTRLNLGIRRRLAPLLDNNRERIELLNSLLFSFPGTPILYYGDEIGMGDNLDLGDRNGVRTPMQWDSSANGGFSAANGSSLYAPVISDPVYGYQAVNVEEQRKNPSSLLGWTRNMIGLRKLFAVFGRGTLRFLNPANRKVIAYLRQFGDESVLCVANLSRFAQPVALDLAEFAGRTPMEVFGYNAFPSITAQLYSLSLAPYSFLWFELLAANAAVPPDPPDVVDGPQPRIQDGPTSQASPANAAGEAAPPDFPASHPGVEVQEVGARSSLLLHATPATPQELDRLIVSLSRSMAEASSTLDATLAFPLLNGDGQVYATDAGRSHPDTHLRVAPYHAPAALRPSWPYPASFYVELERLAEEHHASAVVHLAPAAEPLPWPCMVALADSVVAGDAGLALAKYELGRYRGLLNSAALYPLTRALYCADVRYPLASDAAYSREFLRHLASQVPAGDPASGDYLILWPVLEAVTQSISVAQVDAGVRQFAQPPSPDVTSLLTSILSSLFAVTEQRAAYWQKSRPVYPVRNLAACSIPAQPDHRWGAPNADHPESASVNRPDISSMLESFHLAAGNLQEVWSQVMSPGTLLRIKRLAELPPAEFAMDDTLWVRIVWDFLLAYRGRGVNRNHIFGALVPLYLAWAASYVLQVADLSDAEAEERIAALALTFDADKPYLMARWRWPDRFAP